MRKTRPEDFDPNYRKSLNGPRPEDINMAGIVPIKAKTIYEDHDRKTERKSVRKTERSADRTENRSDIRSENRTATLPLKRRTKRYSFEFFDDQIVTLKQLKIKAEMDGESLSLSEIVRAAMDEYLKDKNND